MIWPETATIEVIEAPGLVANLAALSRATGAVHLVGALSQDAGLRVFNGAFVAGPAGVTGAYHKTRLVPFGEYIPGWFRRLVPVARKLTAGLVDMTPGRDRVPVDLPGGVRAGVMVCYEAVFPGHARALARAGAGIFVNLTNDAWYGRSAATFQHALGPIARAVECGRPVLRCANTGLTLAASPDGRIERSLELFEAGFHAVRVPAVGRPTPYLRWGDGAALIVALAALAAASWWKRP
jgi:apolipoprotein N-acyltransferase